MTQEELDKLPRVGFWEVSHERDLAMRELRLLREHLAEIKKTQRREMIWTTIWTAILCSCAVLVLDRIISADEYLPILRVEEKQLLIDCGDGSTQWTQLPQCKEVK